jgi:SAM-dependent methyltransferase
MTDSFARRFQRVYAFDVSGEMLQRGEGLLKERHNIVWTQGTGRDLMGIADNSVDFVFSYLVLQHLPTVTLVLHYVQEMLRTLKDEGVFLFQFNGNHRPTMNWKGRLVWGIVDGLWELCLNRSSQAIASWMGLDPRMGGKTWHGASVDAASVVLAARAAGGVIWDVVDEGTPMTWCGGAKKAQEGR